MPFLLLNLPREIRDSIYDAVFCVIGGDIKFHEGSLEFTISYGRERLGSGVRSDENLSKKGLERENNFKGAKNEDGDENEDEETEYEETEGEETEDEETEDEETEDEETEDEDEDEDEDEECGNLEIEVEHEAPENTSQENGTQQDPFEYNSSDDASWEPEPSIPDISDYPDSQSFSLPRLGPDHRWMLASKQVLDEAVEQFYRHAHCRTCHNENWRTQYDSDSSTEPYIEKSKEDQVQHPISVFSFARIPSISLSLRLSHDIKTWNGKEYATVVPRRSECEDELDSDDDMRDILAHVKSLGPLMLQRLELRVWMYKMEQDYYDSEASFTNGYRKNIYPSNLPGCNRVDGYKVDLSFLEALGKQFKQLEICLHPTYTHTNAEDGLQGSLVVMPMLQHELVRLAKKLVGNDCELKDKSNVECLAPHWRLYVKRGVAGQQAGIQGQGGLEHIGLKAWEGTNSEGQDEIFLLQEDCGDSFARWKGEHSNEVVEVRKPMVQEEYGEHVFQQSTVWVEKYI